MGDSVSKKLNVSPYEVWNSRKPNLNYFKVWGYVTFYKVFLSLKSKIRTKDFKNVFIDYAQNLKAYMLVDLKTNVIVEFVFAEFWILF